MTTQLDRGPGEVGQEVGGLVDVGDRGVVGQRSCHVGVAEEGLGLARVQAGFGERVASVARKVFRLP
jgi:hypothetical protein